MGKHYDLARQMCNYWANFIKSGDPNGLDATGVEMRAGNLTPKGNRSGCSLGMNPSFPGKKPSAVMDFLVSQYFKD